MEKMVYEIPDFIVTYCYKCQTKSGKNHNGKMKKYTTPEIEEWFSTQLYKNKSIIFEIIKKGNTTYTEICCKKCGKPLTEKQILKGQEFCSYSCSGAYTMQQEETKEKLRKTNIQKYGVANPNQCKEIQEKKRKTCLEKYGVTNPQQSKAVQEKTQQTNLDRYGVKHPYQSEEIRNKGEQTTFEHYGVYHALQSDTVKEKYRETCKNNFGVDNPSQSEEIKTKRENVFLKNYGVKSPFLSEDIQEKIRNTNLEKYGVDNPLSSEEIQQKIAKTNLEKYGVANPSQNKEIQKKKENTTFTHYGVNHPFQSKEVQEKAKETSKERYGTEWYSQSTIARTEHRTQYWDKFNLLLKAKHIEPLFAKEEYINALDTPLQFKCTLCGSVFETDDLNTQHIRCDICTKMPYSQKEKDVLAYIKSIYSGEIIENDRTQLNGKELDIFLPALNLGIEFDGNYWHSLEFKPSEFHQQKSLECKERGIRLIHIFEYEWDNKRDKIENLIKNALGIFERTIYARDTVVKEIDSKTYKTFLTKYHLQGEVISKYRMGLFDLNGELLSVVGIGKSRFSDEMELHRFCSKFGVRVIGGFSKLLKHAMSKFNITELVSYIDIAHFSGKGYNTIGFKEIDITVPNYVYVKEGIVLSRYQSQKKFLPKLLGEGFHEDFTERENMFVNGYACIEDAGNFKMLYKVPSK